MSYPECLLPKSHYHKIDFAVITSQSYYLVRHTDSTDILTEEKRLKAQCVTYRTDHLKDFSTNLLGDFTLNDIQWNWIKGTSCLNLWKEGEQSCTPILEIDVEIKQGRGCFYLQVQKFQTTIFPDGRGSNIQCLVKHTPTCGNFWHCSLRWVWQGDDVADWGDGKQAEKKRRHILSAATTFIIENATVQEPNYQSVPLTAYGASEEDNQPAETTAPSTSDPLNPAINATASGPASPVSLIDNQSAATSSDMAVSAASKWAIIWASIRTQWAELIRKFQQ